MSPTNLAIPPELRNPRGLPTIDDPMSIVVMNNKGGVGKSTILRELLMFMAQWHIRSRGIDVDPQANLSRRLGFGPFPEGEERPLTLAWAIREDEPGCGQDIVLPATWEINGQIVDDQYLDLLPSELALDNREAETGLPAAHSRLANIMTGMDPVAFNGFDCRPSVGHLTQQAMIAAGQSKRAGVIIVVEPEQDGVLGAKTVADFVDNFAGRLGVPHLKVIGVVVNRYRSDTIVHEESLKDLRDMFGDKLWEPYLPLWTVLASAQDTAAPLSDYREAKAKEMRRMLYSITKNMLEAV